jgi:hypothetical protein
MIHKSFDEMTGNGQALTDSVVLFKAGGWLAAKQEVTLCFGIVVGDDFRKAWLIANSRLLDWAFIGNTDVLALVDGNRHKFEGFVQESDTQIVGDDVICVESFHTPVTEEFLAEIAGAQTAKVRLAGTDFELPPEIIADVKELIKSI